MSGAKFGQRLRGLGAGWQNNTAGWLTRSQIKSVQRGTIAIGTGATSNTATITSVRPENTRLNYLGFSSENAAASITEVNAYLELTNATTVTATHTLAGQNLTVAFEVIEYWPGVIRQVQRGTIVIANGNTTNTAAISPALPDLTKAEVSWLGNASTGTVGGDYTGRLTLTSASVLTATRIGNTGTQTTSYQLIQWF